MSSTNLKKQYDEKIVPALTKEFSYTTPMQVPRLKKIVINEGLGEATQDKQGHRDRHQRAHCHHRPESCGNPFEEGYLELQGAQEDAYRCTRDTAPRAHV